MRGLKILLGVTGSIAAYKACELVRRLKDEGADVTCLLTHGAAKFVTPLTFSALSGHPVVMEIWDESLWKMAHLEFAESANLILVAPASADALARMAAGFCHDVLGATILAAPERRGAAASNAIFPSLKTLFAKPA